MPDGSIGDFVSEQPRPVPRVHHFEPQLPPAPVRHAPLPMKGPKPAHLLAEPRLQPVSDTHTNKLQPDHFKMQFQLEPATRTRVKIEGVNAKIHDYERAEVFTRAPWPHYREILINRPRHMHALNPAIILQLENMIHALEFNKDITAGLLAPLHAGENLKLHTPSATAGSPGAFEGAEKSTYVKAFSSGMCTATLQRLLAETQENKKRHARRARDDPDYEPTSKDEVIDAMPGSPLLAKYFRSLYALSFRFANIRLPLVPVLDGVTSGAAAGVVCQNRYRVATENTRISFPQASQGWFPDAGASYTLSRLDGRMGMFLAMTGWEVRGYDAVRLGLATHYCESDETHRFGKRIGDSSLTFQFAEDTVEQAFGMFSDAEQTHFPLPLPELHRVLDDLFNVPTVEGVFVSLHAYQADLALMEQYLEDLRLAAAAAPHARFGQGAKKPKKPKTTHSFAVLQFVADVTQKLLAASPLSLKCIFKLMRLAQFLPLERCLQLEYRLAQRMLCATANPAEADLFRAAAGQPFKHTSFASVPDALVDKMFEESWDEDQEFVINYEKAKKPTWYI